jgi:3-oxoacyl-[acyl-carrier protein] reductase
MQLSLKGKRALVGGASSGIGRACAVELAKLGCDVTALSRSADALRELVVVLPNDGTQTHDFIPADLSQPAATEAAIKAKLDPARPWHIFVNNTGGPAAGAAIDAMPEQLLAAFNSQLIAGHLIVKLLLPGFKAAQFGRIINITSTSVKSPIPNLGVSNIIRPAVAAWAKCLATELGPLGVTANNVLPGYTDTDRLGQLLSGRAAKQGVPLEAVRADLAAGTPVGRFGTAEEIAAAVAFLASPAGAYINGVNLPVDGGRLGTL